MTIEQDTFGTTKNGDPAHLFTLINDAGMTARITDFGAALVQLHVPDGDGQTVDVVGGFEDVAGYESPANAKFGATVGPVANRIGGAAFTLDGETYRLHANQDGNTLHSGDGAFDAMRWSSDSSEDDHGPAVTLTARHPDDRAGFPGNVEAQVTYTLTADNTLRIAYRATTDKPTPINLTNHSYFNLSGHDAGRIGQHVMTIHGSYYTPLDAGLIPTGEITPVAGTPYDFRAPRLVGDGLEALRHQGVDGGFDINYFLDREDVDAGGLAPVAYVREPGSGRAMEVRSTQPCVQFYTGGGLSGQAGKGGVAYGPLSLFCLETQHPPDAVNHADFPSTILRPGETYEHMCELRFSTL